LSDAPAIFTSSVWKFLASIIVQSSNFFAVIIVCVASTLGLAQSSSGAQSSGWSQALVALVMRTSAIQWLEEHRIPVSYVAGTSTAG
jgi:hypothetical protein